MKRNISNEPDAGFHDIGKLINWDAVGLRSTTSSGRMEPDPHEFQKCVATDWSSEEWGIIPDAAPWQSVLTWHSGWPEKFAGSMHRWHAKAADWLISGYGRSLDERQIKGDPREGVYCLWTGTQHDDPRLRSAEDLKSIIQFLNGSPSWPEAAHRYSEQLLARAETARPGLNVTTLAAHCATVGKLARVLAQQEWLRFDPSANPSQKAIRAAQHAPQLITSHLKLAFRQRPFRARDLGLFHQMRERLNGVIEHFPDSVLSQIGFQLVGAFSTADSYRDFLYELEQAGFAIRVRVVDANLKAYLEQPSQDMEEADTAGLMKVTKEPWQHVYVDQFPQRLELPICEGCQMAHASKHWPKDHLGAMPGWGHQTRQALLGDWRSIAPEDLDSADRDKLASWLAEWGDEDLCEQCFVMRRNSEPVPLLKDWRGEVVYVRMALDLDRLENALQYLHRQYLESLHPELDPRLLDKLFVSFPLVVDFVTAWASFVADLTKQLGEQYSQRLAVLEESLLCVATERDSDLLDLLDLFHARFQTAFPKLLGLPREIPNPIGIALSLSPGKHPFFDHWRFLEEPTPDISIQAVGTGRATLRLADYSQIKAAVKQPKRSQVHRLASAAAVSPALGQVILRERDDKGRLQLDKLTELVPSMLDLQSARLLANLIGG